MFEKIEIIYDFNGYADPDIKDVKISRVNGYKRIIKKEGGKIMEEYKLKSLNGSDAKRILEIADQENIDVEAIIDFIKKLKGVKKMSNDKEEKDEERYTEEVKKVEKYQSEHPDLSYRDCVLAVLDRTEPEPKKEFTAEEKKQKENFKKVEEYILEHPRSSYKDAVKIVLLGGSVSLEDKLIEEYQSKNPKSTYKEAVVEALSILESGKKEE